MKYSFIITALCGLLITGGACTPENESEDGKSKKNNRTPLIVKATASDFNHLSTSGNPSARTPLEDGAETLFSAGDAIGVFAVKNNAIADAVNNIKLTYKKIDLNTGEWIPPTGTSLYGNEGMDYIAYYPYKEGVTIDARKTPDEIIASLADNEKLKPGADQSGSDKYTACDLMTAAGKVSGETLTFEFEHRFALLILKPQAHFKYVPPTGAVFTYREKETLSDFVVDVTAKNVQLNSVTPCKMDDGSFRAIVLPTKTATAIAGSYSTTGISSSGTSTDNTLTYSFTPSTAFTAGYCYTLEVKSPLSAVEKIRELTPGDFVFFTADNKIEIFPGDGVFEGDTIPDYKNAAGMVITSDPTKMTDPECHNKGWTHAYVMGLENIGVAKWGDEKVDETGIPDMTTNDLLENNMNGYSETQAILDTYNDTQLKDTYKAFYKIKEHRTKNKIPNDENICSPWFMPSIGQWFDLLINIGGKSPREFERKSTYSLETIIYGTETREKISKQLAKAGSSLGEIVGNRNTFRCTTESNVATDVWILIWHFEMLDGVFWERVAVRTYSKLSDSGYNVRPFFAF